MPTCKVTKSLNGRDCGYSVSGASKAWLANWYPPVVGAVAVVGAIAYRKDTNGFVDKITLPTGEFFFEIGSEENTLSFGDVLLVGGGGGKYRQHSLNAVLNQYDIDVLDEGDALSLGKFICVVLDNAGRYMLLGRTSGIKAPAGGFDYNSGAAEGDATGWTIVQQGVSTEIAPLVKDATVITPIYVEVVTP